MVTKTGSEMVKLARIRSSHLKKPFELAYKGAKKPLEGAAKATSFIGEQVAKRPSTGIPIVGLGGYGAYKAKDDFQKKYIHTDPQTDVTRRVGFGDRWTRVPSIKYSDPKYKKHFKNRNLIY